MDRFRRGLAEVSHAGGCDRFADWSPNLARAALVLLAVLLLLAAIAPGYSPPPVAPPKVTVTDASGKAVVRQEDDNDLRLYRLILARVRNGDGYYHAAVEEQRRNNYPVAPGFTVRLPTLALVSVAAGETGLKLLGIVLFAAMMLAAARRIGEEPAGPRRRPLALTLLFTGIGSGLNWKYNVLHEIWAAQLMALSFMLYRPERGRWGWAWLVAALGLAVRELVLPYVLLLGVYAAWHRRWREAGAWLALIGLYAIGLAVHLHLAQAQVVPGDPVSPSWLALKGLSGLLYKEINSTFLSVLPLWLGGPLIVLALFGWSGWRTPTGSLGFLLVFGYAVAFMIAGRDNNFYWGILIAPLLFMGAAFVPLSLPALWRRAALPLRDPEPMLA